MPSTTVAAETASPAGLSAVAAARRLATEGPNSIGADQGRRWAGILAGQFRSPLVLVLVAAAGVSHLLGERVETGVILVIVAVNALLGFGQEYRAEHAVRLLRRLVTHCSSGPGWPAGGRAGRGRRAGRPGRAGGR